MIDVDKALDSMKFNTKLGDLINALKKKSVSDEEKKLRLGEFFEAAEPFFSESPR